MKLFKRTMALALILALLVAGMPVQVFAQEENSTAVTEVRFFPNCEASEFITISNSEATLDVPFNTTINPYRFEIEFTNPSQLGYVWISSTVDGARRTIAAHYDEKTGNYVAEGFFDPENPNYVPEDVRIEYTIKSSAPEVGSDVDWEAMEGQLNQHFLASTVNNTNDGENSAGTVEFSQELEGLQDMTMEYYIKTVENDVDLLKDIRDYCQTSENVLSYVIPGMDDSRYIAYLDLTDPNDCKVIIDDGLDVGGKIVEIAMSFMDKETMEYYALEDVSSLMSNVGSAVDLVYELYNIQEEMDGIEDEIITSQYFSEEELKIITDDVDNLRKDRMRFAVLITTLPIIVAAGAVAGPAAAVFSGMISVMTVASDAVYSHRLAGLKDRILDAQFNAIGVGYSTESYSWHFCNDTMTISADGALPPFKLEYTYPIGEGKVDDVHTSSIRTLRLLEGVTTINYGNFSAFYNLETVQLPESLFAIGQDSFRNCTKMKSFVVPGNVEYLDMSAFEGCNSLESIIIPETVKKLYCELPTGCDALTDIYYEGTVDQWELIENHELITVYNDPEEWTSDGLFIHMQNHGTFGNSRWTFSEESGELTITGSSNMASLKKYESSYEFAHSSDIKYPWRHCGGRIKTVRIGDSIEKICDNAFSNHTSIEHVILGSSVNQIGSGAFSGCTGIQDLHIPGNVINIGSSAFMGCSGIENLTLSEGVTYISGYAFENCDSLKEVTIPDSALYMGQAAFSDCDNLETVILAPNCTLDWQVFAGCDKLSSVTIPYGVKDISGYAFSGCESLENISIPGSVSWIGREAFYGCSGLKELVFPSSVTTIDQDAFSQCTSLKKVTFLGSAPELEKYNGSFSPVFVGVTLDAYYPGNDESWTSEVRTDFGENINWIAYNAYKILEDSKTVASKDKKDAIVIHSNGELKDFRAVSVDGQTLESSKYTLKEGSTILTFQTEYLETLVEGTHTYTIEYVDGYADGTFEIRSQDSGDVPTEPKPTEPDATEPKPTEPEVTEPKPTEPKPTEPAPTEPEAPKVEGVTRLAGADRLVTSYLVADQLKARMGVEKFENIIVASGATFADALPGSYLSAVKNAPILLTLAKDKYVNQTADYIKANLASDGTVYILGGESAVPASMEAALAGIKVQRVAGADRFGTNLAILKEAGVKAGDEILVCTAREFADSLSASATGMAILLVYKKLTAEQKAYLATLSNCKFTVVGGTTAVPDSIAKEVEAYGSVSRLAGKDRLETSTMVAENYFKSAKSAVVAYGWNFPDGLCGGSLAYAMDAPLILAHSKEKLAQFTADYTTKAGLKVGYVLGGDGLVDDAATRAIFGMGSELINIVK